MRANERKGAWTLLICVLLFGALVWGLGARRMREDEKLPAKVETLEMNADSVAGDDARGTASAASTADAQQKRLGKVSEILQVSEIIEISEIREICKPT